MGDKFNVNQTMRDHMFDLTGTKQDELNQNARIFNMMYTNHYNYLINIITSLFTWEGLPTTADGLQYESSFFERLLTTNGTCAIADSNRYGVVISPCVIEGLRNVVGDPKVIRLYPGINQSGYEYPTFNERLEESKDKFVFCRNDNTETGLLYYVYETAYLLTTTRMSEITNISQQKFQTLIAGKRNSNMNMEIMQNKMDSFDKYILIKDGTGVDLEGIKTLNRDMPYVADKLHDSYTDILNTFFERIGINTNPSAKRERLLKDEVNANNQAVQSAGDIMFRNRQEICDKYNDMFGGNLSVQRNTDLIDGLRASGGGTDMDAEEVDAD